MEGQAKPVAVSEEQFAEDPRGDGVVDESEAVFQASEEAEAQPEDQSGDEEAAASGEAAPSEDAAVPAVVEHAVPPQQAEAMRDQARNSYRSLQRGWFEFAKSIAQIVDTSAYTSLGHESFKSFCEAEYPDIAYSTLTKYVAVVHQYGEEIETRLSANPETVVPALESLYQLASAQGRVEEGDRSTARKLSNLIKKVFEGNLSYHSLRDKLAELREASTGTDQASSTEAEVHGIEEQLAGEVVDEVMAEGEEVSAVEEGAVPNAERIVSIIMSQIVPLKDNIAMLENVLTTDQSQVTDEVVSGITEIENFHNRVNDFLNAMERLSNGGEEPSVDAPVEVSQGEEAGE